MSKVTFIFANDDGDSWSTPLSLLNEFAGRGWETEIVSIGSNRTGQYHDRTLCTWVESKPKTDLVIFMDWGRFDSPYLNKQLVPAIWVQESGDDPQNFSRNCGKASRFHITLTPDYQSAEKYRAMGINAHWWTHFADTRIHYPQSNIVPEHVAVTSRGAGGSQLLDTLVQHSDGSIVNKNGFIGIDHSVFLQSGQIVIQNSRWGEITRRIFEAMACGRMVLTDKLSPDTHLDDLFTDGVHIVYYTDIVDCINKINYYTENSAEREAIAAAGYHAVMDQHTQIQRVTTLLQYANSITN